MYNVGLYSVRQHFFNTQQYLNYYQNYHVCKDNENYHILQTNTGQQILRLVDRDMRSFFKLLKMKQLGKYSEKVKLPRYKKKNGLMNFVVQGSSARIVDGKIKIGLTKEFRELYNVETPRIELTIPKHLLCVKEFNEIRVVPMHNGKDFVVEFVYDSSYKQLEQVKAEPNRYMSIDLGVNNLMTCTYVTNTGLSSFIIDGRYIKSLNQYYNKRKANIQSVCDKEGGKLTDHKRYTRLSEYRRNKLSDLMSKSAHYVVRKCIENGIGTLVLGYNQCFKDGCDLNHINNQNFVMIPYTSLISKLKYLCELHGIEYVVQEESYTSKASCLDLDDVPVYGEENGTSVFSGKRKCRGLYVSKNKTVINADVNGSINILRKYLRSSGKADLSADSVGAVVRRPLVRIRINNMVCSKNDSLKERPQAPSFREG
jgi:IS605 OrfB family transposase